VIDWVAEQKKVATRLLAAGLVTERQCKKPWCWFGVGMHRGQLTFGSVVVPAAGDAPERTFLAWEIP